jgi:hypothetical protein
VALEDAFDDVGVPRRDGVGRVEALGLEDHEASDGIPRRVEQRPRVPDPTRGGEAAEPVEVSLAVELGMARSLPQRARPAAAPPPLIR